MLAIGCFRSFLGPFAFLLLSSARSLLQFCPCSCHSFPRRLRSACPIFLCSVLARHTTFSCRVVRCFLVLYLIVLCERSLLSSRCRNSRRGWLLLLRVVGPRRRSGTSAAPSPTLTCSPFLSPDNRARVCSEQTLSATLHLSPLSQAQHGQCGGTAYLSLSPVRVTARWPAARDRWPPLATTAHQRGHGPGPHPRWAQICRRRSPVCVVTMPMRCLS